MPASEQEQYAALRATIRERGTARVYAFIAGLVAWAALTLGAMAMAAPPIATLVPLLILGATFEAVFALHAGVERVGRYLEVFFDDEWERALTAFGRPQHAVRSDALFVVVFALAGVWNLMPALVAQPTSEELVFIGGAHALFGVRLVYARFTASKQREVDRARFRELHESSRRHEDHESQMSRSS